MQDDQLAAWFPRPFLVTPKQKLGNHHPHFPHPRSAFQECPAPQLDVRMIHFSQNMSQSSEEFFRPFLLCAYDWTSWLFMTEGDSVCVSIWQLVSLAALTRFLWWWDINVLRWIFWLLSEHRVLLRIYSQLCAQGLLQVILGLGHWIQEPCILDMESMLAECKASTLLTILPLWPLLMNGHFFNQVQNLAETWKNLELGFLGPER